ncbi:protein PF14_0175-like [Ctenocephalides felis]|uniref:protein PF14_0175-like n=1 Tax=Ctenocephalides felis TaxID=7515 RepID=UPI000E6E20D7|nr:protein PF14_0175-like [Ctenocephalides felis]
MLLSEHLDTHPKDQVILALTNLVERQRSSSNSSPWITVTKPSSTVINSSQSSENIRLDWADNSIRAPNWPKVQEESWVGNRSSVLASSSRTAYWQSHQSTEYGSESRFNTPSFNYSYTKRDSHQLIRPVTRKHENIQKNSTTIPVIQRIEHSNNDVRPLPSPTSNYKYNDYSEHQGVYDRLNTMEQNDNLVDNQGCTSEKSFNIETVEIDVPSVVCMNNEISRLQSINISSDKALRRDLSSNLLDLGSQLNQTKSLKHSKEEIICKQNIEIISHSVVSNPKSFKNTDVSSLIVKQKNEELNGLHEISTYENSNLINNNENLQGWKEFSQGDSDEKLLYSDELDDEKSFETNSESVYDSDHRKTMFSPNLVIINLETNNEKLDSPEKLLDIDICQPNLRNGPVYVKPKNDKEDKQTDKYKKINCTEIESYPDQSNFDHSNMPTEEFSSHCGSKINTSDNLKQNLDCSLSSESLNIRTDEKMPARGELSEQESTDSSSWAYQNACSSFPLNLPVDENELNLSQYLSPMLEPSSSCSLVNHIDGSRSSKSNSTIKQLNIFKCPHCADEFVCAKERRVHISRCHPTQTTHTFEHNESLRNSFEFSEDYYTHNSSNHNDQNNISNIEQVEVDCQTKKPLEDMHIEMKNTDIKTDFNSFNLNQQDTFTDTNIKWKVIFLDRVPRKKL